jgi:hypothetical protein
MANNTCFLSYGIANCISYRKVACLKCGNGYLLDAYNNSAVRSVISVSAAFEVP